MSAALRRKGKRTSRPREERQCKNMTTVTPLGGEAPPGSASFALPGHGSPKSSENEQLAVHLRKHARTVDFLDQNLEDQ